MMYMPLSGLLCDSTSDLEMALDMMSGCWIKRADAIKGIEGSRCLRTTNDDR